jgi:hypothetical protein
MVLDRQRGLLRGAVESNGGVVVDCQGDAMFAAFGSAGAGVAAAATAQAALASEGWPDGTSVRVRMALHTGEPHRTADGYTGIDVVRAARLCAAGHGGQVLMTEPTRLLSGADTIDLGAAHLPDMDESEHVHQLVVPGLEQSFPPLRRTSATPLETLDERTASTSASTALPRRSSSGSRTASPRPSSAGSTGPARSGAGTRQPQGTADAWRAARRQARRTGCTNRTRAAARARDIARRCGRRVRTPSRTCRPDARSAAATRARRAGSSHETPGFGIRAGERCTPTRAADSRRDGSLCKCGRPPRLRCRPPRRATGRASVARSAPAGSHPRRSPRTARRCCGLPRRCRSRRRPREGRVQRSGACTFDRRNRRPVPGVPRR